MLRKIATLPLAVVVFAACADSPTGTGQPDASGNPSTSVAPGGEIIFTVGAPAPLSVIQPSRSDAAPAPLGSTAVGSFTTPLSLAPTSCGAASTGTVTVTYRVDGAQAGTATFDVPTTATWNGTGWTYSNVVTKNVAGPRVGQTPVQEIPVLLTVVNASSHGAGAPTPPAISLEATNVTNSNTMGAKLAKEIPAATVHVTFIGCGATNTKPTVTVPGPITEEATSSAGAAVTFSTSANDAEDGALTPSCDYESGDIFPIGETTVTCSVTDSGGLTASESFTITVVDTTPAYFVTFPTGTLMLIADDINGASFDVGDLGITVADVGNVSEPSAFACGDYTAGTAVKLEIGSTTTVSCTATDARGNESPASTFDVYVGLNVAPAGFLSPLRMSAPFSSHKLNSTIPHKFLPPTYADGTPATDLAGGLQLVFKRLDGTVDPGTIEVNDYSAGSTMWRYDAESGHYIFNAKTATSSPWAAGTWKTTVSYAGIVLATTEVNLKK